ncbi:homoserine kinase [Candidatus Epulonipiscium viviparus]|uniref:homoserine kinase n=1 Tax=Candidatus Epulonipiscium viviparus TaxID=420336 RepID=UPI00016BFDBB|nr:homoserine kinase [Candidatus Epulopiscium viviparus]
MKVTVKVPASTANIGSGIDCLGVGLSKYLTVVMEDNDKFEIIFKQGFNRDILLDENLFYTGAKRIFAKAGRGFPLVKITMVTDIPGSRGLGSSASAIVAGVYAANAYLNDLFTEAELISEASLIEGHPDNVVPCAVGGFTISMMDNDVTHYHKIVPNRDLRFITAIPDYELPTKLARSVIPKEFSRTTLVTQLQRACFLVGALASGDIRQLEIATQDLIFTPARKDLIPGFDAVTSNAMAAGAICSMISGAGPTLIAFATHNLDCIAAAMRQGFTDAQINSTVEILRADTKGAVVITEI